MYQVVDGFGVVLATGPTEEAAIVAAVTAMPEGEKQHCAAMGITPRDAIENLIENEEYTIEKVA